MAEGSFYRICTQATIFMIILTLSINFVVLSNVFPVPIDSPVTGTNTSNIAANITGNADIISGFMGGNWATLIITSAGFLLGLAAVLVTQNWSIVGIYIFGYVFWAAWINCLWIFNLFNMYNYAGVTAMFTIITVVMVFIFIGAVVGMLTGSDN